MFVQFSDETGDFLAVDAHKVEAIVRVHNPPVTKIIMQSGREYCVTKTTQTVKTLLDRALRTGENDTRSR